MLDANFDGTVIYLFDTGDGTAGVVLNRPTAIPVTDVLPGLTAALAEPAVVFHGGPVQVEHGVVLGLADSEIHVLDVEAAADATCESARVFAGYAGWEAGQLKGEIDAGGWFVIDATSGDILTPDPGGLWRAVFARQPGAIRWYRNFPDDPRLN